MSNRRPAHLDGRPTFPDVAEDIGEDPARFIVAGGELLASRLKGIDRVEVARKWIEVEIALAEQLDRDVNQELIGWLNRRIDHLREHGGRDEQLERRRELVDDVDGPEVDPGEITWKHVKCGGTDVEMEKAGVSWYCQDCEMRCPKNRVEAV